MENNDRIITLLEAIKEGIDIIAKAAQRKAAARAASEPKELPNAAWVNIEVPKFIKKYAGRTLGDMAPNDIGWWAKSYEPREYKGQIQQRDIDFKRYLVEAAQHYGIDVSQPVAPRAARPAPSKTQQTPDDEEVQFQP